MLGRYVETEFGLCVVRWPYLSLSVADLDTCLLPSDNRYFSGSIEIGTRFCRKAICKDSFLRRVTFVKNVHADFYGDLDVNFVMTVFDPNSYPPSPLESWIVDEILACGWAS